MMTIEQLDLAKRYCAIVPETPSEQPVESANPSLANLFCEAFNVLHPLPDTLTESDVVKALDYYLIP